jgi:hypothetical protein
MANFRNLPINTLKLARAVNTTAGLRHSARNARNPHRPLVPLALG